MVMNDEVLGQAEGLYQEALYEEAFVKYLWLASNGDTECQKFVGWLCEIGRGTDQSYVEAEKWYLLAAQSGDSEGQHMLAKVQIKRNKYDSAIQFLQSLATKNYYPAVVTLALCYNLGRGVEKDQQKFLELMKSAASGGNLYAKTIYARHMITGKMGVWAIPRGVLAVISCLIDGVVLIIKGKDSESLRY